MEDRYTCRIRDKIPYTPDEARVCCHLYQENKCRFGGYCSVLETELESFELPKLYRHKNLKPKSL